MKKRSGYSSSARTRGWLLKGLLCLGLASLLGVGGVAQAVTKKVLTEPPRLVVVMVIDQMRADYLRRHHARFLEPRLDKAGVGGFRFLMDEGAYYASAEFQTMHTLTAPDHATIATGAWANRHGVVMNQYLDDSLTRRYCVGDGRFRTIGAHKESWKGGVAPTNLLGPTVGDALKNAGYRGSVVSIALKDRAAILMGGFRSDASIWFDYRAHRWVTSSYFAPTGKLPTWVQRANGVLAKHVGKKFVLSGEGAGSGHSDDGPVNGYKRTVRVGQREAMETPYGHAIVVDAALGSVEAYKMGSDDEPDLLWVGFSAIDYLGHGVGPNHREMEESLVALDRQISRFLNALQKQVPGGLKRVSVVLTGDHGAPPMPSYLKRNKTRAGYLDAKSLRQRLNQHLDQVFGPDKLRQWVGGQSKLHFYLDRAVMKEAGVNRVSVEEASQEYLSKLPNVAYVAIRSEIVKGRAGPGLLGQQIINGYFAGRSGDIVVIPSPFFMPKVRGLTHITGYTYDRSVPLIFYGQHFRKNLFASNALMIDLAPTLSFLLGFTAPALSEGRVLHEAFRDGP
jgi:hypothetical protein